MCLKACPLYFKRDKEQNKIIFDDPENLCSLCGRCVCRCPEDAILHEGLGEMPTFEGVQDPSALISYETLHKFMISKRSIREYKNKKVSRDVMEKVLNSMKYAPTGANVRTLCCTIISDDDKIKELSDAVIDFLIAADDSYREGSKQAKALGLDRIFYKAPHVLIIHSENPGDSTNSTIALDYGMLSAQSLGLASCWIGLAYMALKNDKRIREEIAGIKGEIWGVIILGYPTKSQTYYRLPPRPDIKTTGLDELG
jgi:nitroreductase